MQKIVAVSDTHLFSQEKLTNQLHQIFKNNPESILIHAGDALNEGSFQDAVVFLKWFESLPFEHKIFVPGNHDCAFDDMFKPSYASAEHIMKMNISESKTIAPSIEILINNVLNINGITFGGVSSCTDFWGWAFWQNENTIKRLFDAFPKVDVLISHAPFKGCDSFNENKFMKNYLIKNNIKTVICGHMHRRYGFEKVSDVNIYNVSILNDEYEHVNPPTLITI